jgi:hypothetical protein
VTGAGLLLARKYQVKAAISRGSAWIAAANAPGVTPCLAASTASAVPRRAGRRDEQRAGRLGQVQRIGQQQRGVLCGRCG